MRDKKIVIFDFCGTLITFQTADRYVMFCIERLHDSKVVRWRHFIIRMMDKLRVFKIYNLIHPDNNWRKRMVLWQMKGVSYELCDKLAKNYFEEGIWQMEIECLFYPEDMIYISSISRSILE